MAAVQGDTLLLRRTRLILQCLVLIGAGLFIFVPLPIKGKITTNQKVRFRRQREESQTDSSIGKITKKDDPVEYEYDAVIIPGGGVKANGAPKESVVARLDEAARTYDHSAKYFVVLSRGTTHKPPPLGNKGFPVDEAVSSAQYLMRKYDIAEDRILMETWSLDTIGNAYFTSKMITEPLKLNKLAVVTSLFHNNRTEAIFKWVWRIVQPDASLTFTPSVDAGFTDEQLAERRMKEAASLKDIAVKKERYNTDAKLASFVFLAHGAYAARSEERPRTVSSDAKGLAATYRH